MNFHREVSAALRLAKEAGQLALSLQKGIVAESKADASPVTIADKQSEKLIAAGIEQAFPEDGILGEEGAGKASTNGRKWIIDPIDGTRDFVRGNFLWAVLIGVEEEGEVKAGVVHLPVLGQSFWATRGSGAYRGASIDNPDQQLRVSTIASIEEAVLSFNSLHILNTTPLANKAADFMSRFWAVRVLGGTPDATLLAEGKLEVWIEPRVAPWDLAAPSILIEEAGAHFSDYKGNRTIYGGNAVGCVPPLKNEILSFVSM
jgi:histidinol phosphatase-like enzyme (inositol monophosphatase family)